MNNSLKYHILERLEHLEIPESLHMSRLCMRFLYQDVFNPNSKSFFKGGYYVITYSMLLRIIRRFINYLEFGCPITDHSYVPFRRKCDVERFTSHQYFKGALECGALIIVCIDHVGLIDAWKQASIKCVSHRYKDKWIIVEEDDEWVTIDPSRIGLRA